MDRRQAITALASLTGALASPLLSAQERRGAWRLGILVSYSLPTPPETERNLAFLVKALRDLGYIVGQNISFEWRSASGRHEGLPGLAAQLVDLKVDLILTGGTPAARAAQRATSSIPIVMVGVGDPIGTGLAVSLAHPGGNLTGIANLSTDIDPQRLGLLMSAVPKSSGFAAMLNPENPTHAGHIKVLRDTAEKAKVKLLFVDARTPSDIEAGFKTIKKYRASGLYVQQDSSFFDYRKQIAAMAIAAHMPTIFGASEYAEAGGLISYGYNAAAGYQRAASYIDRILKGAKPGDLPIEQVAELELVVNLRTANALKVTLPPDLRIRANRIIE